MIMIATMVMIDHHDDDVDDVDYIEEESGRLHHY